MGGNHNSGYLAQTLIATAAESHWRQEAGYRLAAANDEKNKEKRVEYTLDFAAYEVLARLAHTLRETPEGWEWPERVDIRIVQQAVHEVIGSIALHLLVNVSVDEIVNRADKILFPEVCSLRSRNHQKVTDAPTHLTPL